MIKRIQIRNFRIFESIDIDLHPAMNIVVGLNDSGKTTLLDAVNLALTGRLHGAQLVNRLSPYDFNLQTTAAWIKDLRDGKNPPPPVITIEVYLEQNDTNARLKGSNNLAGDNAVGLQVKVELDPDLAEEYKSFVATPEKVTLVPAEYYRVEWSEFSGNPARPRRVPASASLIDASSIRLASGADAHLQDIISASLTPKQRVELSREYRTLREQFSNNAAVSTINSTLTGAKGDITDHDLTMSIDISQRATWEATLTPHLKDLPFHHIGRGEQSSLKILLALTHGAKDSHVVLVEEPENHLTFSAMQTLVQKIEAKCASKQVLISTHSTFVLNKLGLDSLLLMTPTGAETFAASLPDDTLQYFKRLPGYDTLRLVLADKVILVEGPSDELVVKRAYLDKWGHEPGADGVDVISARALSFARFLDLAVALQRSIVVVQDNDDKPQNELDEMYKTYQSDPNVKICIGHKGKGRTLEPQLISSAGRAKLNTVLGKKYSDDAKLLTHLTNNKTEVALAIYESDETLTMPGYIVDAIS